jgi:hypothetical protein
MAHSLHRLLRAGRRVRWDWLTPPAALFVVAAVVNTWWTTGQAFSQALTLAAFLPNLVSLILLFLLASAILPDEVPAEGLDLGAYYLSNRTYFWGLFSAWVAALVLNESLILARSGRSAIDIVGLEWANVAFMPLFGLLMWTRWRWVHGLVLAFCLVVIVGSWARLLP